jgi:hypothetical protein
MSSINRTGTRAQVMHGSAKQTGGGLKKKDLKYNKRGKIVSKKASAIAKKEKRLQKAGWMTKKGQFGAVRSMRGGATNHDMDNNERRYNIDGELYTRNKFIEYYEGNTEWNEAMNRGPKQLYEDYNANVLERILNFDTNLFILKSCMKQIRKYMPDEEEDLGDFIELKFGNIRQQVNELIPENKWKNINIFTLIVKILYPQEYNVESISSPRSIMKDISVHNNKIIKSITYELHRFMLVIGIIIMNKENILLTVSTQDRTNRNKKKVRTLPSLISIINNTLPRINNRNKPRIYASNMTESAEIGPNPPK